MNRKLRVLRGLMSACVGAAFVVCADVAAAGPSWYVTPGFVVTYADSDTYAGRDESVGLAFGLSTPGWPALEIEYGENSFVPKRRLGSANLDVLRLNSTWPLMGFWGNAIDLEVGAGAARESSGVGDDYLPMGSLGLGLRWQLSRALSLQTGGRARYFYGHNDGFDTNNEVVDSEALMRLRYVFWNGADNRASVKPSAAVPQAPAPVATEACVGGVCAVSPDVDGDSVRDDQDRCQNTNPGVTVDADGCTVGRSP